MRISSWGCALFLAVNVCLVGAQELKVLTLTRGLTVNARENVEVQVQRRAEDFELFTFKHNSKLLMNAYVGNQPDFPIKKDSCPVVKTTVNGLAVESVMHPGTNGLALNEVLFHLQENNGWPQRLHCWYTVSTNDMNEIKEMLSTVRFKSK
jgi:hypothetical protein